MERRRQLAENKKVEKKLRQKQKDRNRMIEFFFRYQKIGPDLIYGPNLVPPRSLPKNKKRDDSIFRDAFQDLLRITPDIFQETFVGGLGLKIPAQNKGKGVPTKKKTTGLVQGDVGLMEEVREEEVLQVRVNTRGRIIRNTRKM